MSEARFKRRHVAQQAVASGSLAGAELAVSAIAAAALGPGGFGVVASAIAAATVCFALVDARLHEAVVALGSELESRNRAGERTRLLRRLFMADLGTGVLGALLVCALIPLAPFLPGSLALPPALLALGGAVLLARNAATAVCRSYLRVSGRFESLAWLTAIGAVLRVAAVLPALLGWVNVEGPDGPLLVLAMLALGNAASALVLVLPTVAIAMRDGLAARGEPLTREDVRRTLLYVRGSWLFSLSLVPLRELDVAILAALAGDSTVGVYRLARTGIAGADALLSPVHLAIYPHMARLWHHGHRAQLAMFLRRCTRLLAIGGTAAAAAGIALAPWVVPLVGGAEYRPSVPLLQVMLCALPVVAASLWLLPLLAAAGFTHRTAAANLAGGAASVAIMVALTPSLGAWGPVMGYLAFAVAQTGAGAWLALRVPDVRAVLQAAWRGKSA